MRCLLLVMTKMIEGAERSSTKLERGFVSIQWAGLSTFFVPLFRICYMLSSDLTDHC